jgi:hypothetical protein
LNDSGNGDDDGEDERLSFKVMLVTFSHGALSDLDHIAFSPSRAARLYRYLRGLLLCLLFFVVDVLAIMMHDVLHQVELQFTLAMSISQSIIFCQKLFLLVCLLFYPTQLQE